MDRREGTVKSLGEIIERNIRLQTNDPVVRGGFTQVPNFVLKDSSLSLGAKVSYAMFLHYAWNNDSCFPGQDRLAKDMGMSRSRVTEFIGELEAAGLVGITRRGQGKTNLYTIKFVVKKGRRQPHSKLLMSIYRHQDVGQGGLKMSAGRHTL
jgi:hypothetical protein